MDLILYNPKSKNSKGNVQTHKLIKYYKKNNIPFRLKSILKIKDLKEFLESKKNISKVILLGGDGTINKFVNNVYDYDIKQDIYLKKNGSGNDFLRSLKDHDQNPQYILENILDDNEKHYFINGTGIGIDGLIINYVDSAKKKGKLRYFLNSIKGIINYVPESLDVEIDGEKLHFDKTYMIVVNNGRFVGGGMQMTPEARLDDENLDVMIVHTIPKIFLMLIFTTIYIGLHTKFTKYVYYKKCKHVKASFTTPQITQSDGEKTADITSIEVKSTGKRIHLKAY